MSTELVAQRGDHLCAERISLSGAETSEQRVRDDRRGNVEVDRFLHGPSTFAGVSDPPFDGGEAGVALERRNRELVEPRSYHAAVLPHFGDLLEVQLRKNLR